MLCCRVDCLTTRPRGDTQVVTGKTWLHNNGLIVKQLRSLGVPLWDEVAEATVFLWSN